LDEKNVIYLERVECYSAFKKKEMLPLWQLDDPGRHHVKWQKPGPERQMPQDLIYMLSLNKLIL
jgi:hypothetical protein